MLVPASEDLDKSEKEQILNNFELGKDANKKARRSLFADEEKARKADARRAAREEEKARKADARRAADEKKEADARRAADEKMEAERELIKALREEKEAIRADTRAANEVIKAAREEKEAERAENHRVGALAAARFEANIVAEMKEMYQQLFYDKVVPKLKRLKFDDSKMLKSSMLNKTERCAFVFVHFKQFHKHKCIGQISHEGIKQTLKAKMEKNNSWSNTLREKTSHNS